MDAVPAARFPLLSRVLLPAAALHDWMDRAPVSLEGLLRGLEGGSSSLQSLYLEEIAPVAASLSLNALIGRVVQQSAPLPVLDAQQRYLGAVTQTALLQKMVEMDLQESGNE